MKFDLLGIVMMIIAIAVAQFAALFLQPYLGTFAGGIMGTFITGAIAYVIYSIITHGKMALMSLVIFSILVIVATFVSGYVATMVGITESYFTLIITGIVASVLYGWVGGKQAKVKVKALKL